MNARLQVKSETTARGNLVRWVAMGDDQYFTIKDTAEMFGVTQQNIKQVVKRQGLMVATMSCEQVAALRRLKVVPIKTTKANLLPLATIDRLVQIINTPESRAMWDEAVRCLRNPKSYVEMRADVAKEQGRDPALELTLISRLAEVAKQQQARLDQLDTRLSTLESKPPPALPAFERKSITSDQYGKLVAIGRVIEAYAGPHALYEYRKMLCIVGKCKPAKNMSLDRYPEALDEAERFMARARQKSQAR